MVVNTVECWVEVNTTEAVTCVAVPRVSRGSKKSHYDDEDLYGGGGGLGLGLGTAISRFMPRAAMWIRASMLVE